MDILKPDRLKEKQETELSMLSLCLEVTKMWRIRNEWFVLGVLEINGRTAWRWFGCQKRTEIMLVKRYSKEEIYGCRERWLKR